jgi:hypothetical protein
MEKTHRQNNFWEPTFKPESSPLSIIFDWKDLEHTNGPKECICRLSSIKDIKRINKKFFTGSDFVDNFDFDTTFTFSECIFEDCHFGWSNWRNVKFQKCTFNSCAFGLTKFISCQFLDCNFKNISVSSNETVFEKCYIDPQKMINNIETNLNFPAILKERGTTKEYQKYRLAISKAKIAKNLLNSLKEYGDEDMFILSRKIFSKQYNISRIKEAIHTMKTGSKMKRISSFLDLFPRVIESLITPVFGFMNRWGYSIGRITIFGIFILIFFTLIYYYQSNRLVYSLIKSFDFTLVAGYTKYDFSTMTLYWKFLHILNLAFGILWFSLFFPTILTKTSNKFE